MSGTRPPAALVGARQAVPVFSMPLFPVPAQFHVLLPPLPTPLIVNVLERPTVQFSL
jgi:hypothetical protein